MVKIRVNVKTSDLKIVENIHKFKDELLEQTSEKGKEILKENTPEDTGSAISSYRIIKSENQHKIVNDKNYLPWVNDGTGIYGPRHQRITPTHKAALHFHWQGREWFLKSVKGQKPQKFVEKSMDEIVGAIPGAVIIASKALK